MRDHVRAFVRLAAESFDLAGPVYEFGQQLALVPPVCGEFRALFPGKPYYGCAMRRGPGVDHREDPADLSLADETAGTILCLETLTTVFEPVRVVDEMQRVLKPGGMLILTASLDVRTQADPHDYWRLTPACLERMLAPLEGTVVGWQGTETFPHTVLGIGIKAPLPPGTISAANGFLNRFQDWLTTAAACVPWQRRLKNQLFGWVGGRGPRRRQRDYFQSRFAVNLPVGVVWKKELKQLTQRQS